MKFPRQEYWSGLPFPSPGVLPDPEMEPAFPAWQVDSLPENPHRTNYQVIKASPGSHKDLDTTEHKCLQHIDYFLGIFESANNT